MLFSWPWCFHFIKAGSHIFTLSVFELRVSSRHHPQQKVRGSLLPRPGSSRKWSKLLSWDRCQHRLHMRLLCWQPHQWRVQSENGWAAAAWQVSFSYTFTHWLQLWPTLSFVSMFVIQVPSCEGDSHIKSCDCCSQNQSSSVQTSCSTGPDDQTDVLTSIRKRTK